MTYMWNQKKPNSEKQRVLTLSGGYQGLGCWSNREMLVKWYKLPVVRLINSEDLICRMVIITKNTV